MKVISLSILIQPHSMWNQSKITPGGVSTPGGVPMKISPKCKIYTSRSVKFTPEVTKEKLHHSCYCSYSFTFILTSFVYKSEGKANFAPLVLFRHF
jgi:hypothetical protein